MPLYEYKCSKCQNTFEFLEKISGKPKTICPKCGTATLKRQISPAGFKLKGTGWYVTDFKDQKKPKVKQVNPVEKSEPKTNKNNKIKTGKPDKASK